MGLDNGIMIKIKDAEKFGAKQLPAWMPRNEWEDKENAPWEIFYWRKCWNIREVIFDFLNRNGVHTVNDCSEDAIMDLETFWGLCNRLEGCYTKRWWKNHSNSIWELNEVRDRFREDLALARRLVGYLEDKDPDSYEISFYDSY